MKDQPITILTPTMKLRWYVQKHQYKVFFKIHTDTYHTLQQLFLDEKGNEVWTNVEEFDAEET